MRQLIYEYKRTLNTTRQAYSAADELTDKPIIGGMIKDLEYAIEWMRIGGDPSRKRGVDRAEVYLTDPDIIDSQRFDSMVNEGTISDLDRQRITTTLHHLTEREEDVYLMHYAEMLSYEEIADLLNTTKSAIGTTCARAERKLNKYLSRKDNDQ
jgi:RNA polymerase sigma-70 factor (ECF subfamily)